MHRMCRFFCPRERPKGKNFPKLAIRKGSFAMTFAPAKNPALPSASNGVNGLGITSPPGTNCYSCAVVTPYTRDYGFSSATFGFCRPQTEFLSKRASERASHLQRRSSRVSSSKKKSPQRAPSTPSTPSESFLGGASSATWQERSTWHFTIILIIFWAMCPNVLKRRDRNSCGGKRVYGWPSGGAAVLSGESLND